MDYFQIPAQDLGKNAKIPVYPLGAVSYTHLDVYKRQAPDGGL